MSKKASRAKPTSSPDAAASEERSFDQRLEDLESIAAELEGGDLGLEEALDHYRRGVHMLRTCREELLAVRAQVEELTGEDGQVQALESDPDGPFEA